MGDFLQEFKNQEYISEGFFDRLLGKKDIVPTNPDFIKKDDGSYLVGGVSTIKELHGTSGISLLSGEFDLKNSKLSFMLLPGTEFHAKQLSLDLKNQTISFFKGSWNSGPFYGQTFQGIFNGSSFNGNFHGPYTEYESNPITFIDGTFRDTTGKGLLGLPNTVTLEKARNRKFNLITIPEGNYLQFRYVNGITGHIKVVKRLDGYNSNFIFEILNGFLGVKMPKIITLPWDYFRQNWHKMEINPKNPRNFGGLIEVPEGDSIKEMYISIAPATFETPVSEPVIKPELEKPETEKGPVITKGTTGLGIHESIRKEVRNIINKNF